MRELSGPAAFEKLQAQLARAAAGMASGKSRRGKVPKKALGSTPAEPDDGHGEPVPPGPG
ncbi:hypothetical protein ACWEQ7_12880 [Streptomyces sp. NPDC004069]